MYAEGVKRLRAAGCPNPESEMKWILQETGEASKINLILAEREAGRPLTKILGKTEFWGLPFIDSDDVLSPRPDSEILVESVIKWARSRSESVKNLLDLGTGSGCLAISIACTFKNLKSVAVDICPNALKIADQNILLNNCNDCIKTIQSDWFLALDPTQKYDIIIANPPYVARTCLNSLEDCAKNHDPDLALYGGDDGLQAYRVILESAHAYLQPNGRIFLEIGFDQCDVIKKIAMERGYQIIEIVKDYGGNDRVLIIDSGDK